MNLSKRNIDISIRQAFSLTESFQDSNRKELESAIQEKNETRKILMNFIKSLQRLSGEQTEFREGLWGGLVDHIRAENEKTVTVVFRGGIEIAV